MTLSSTLSAALSGLGATSRAAKVVSDNLANAMNENYGRRELNLRAADHSFNGGVHIDGVRRVVDPVLLADKRSASAEMGLQSSHSATLTVLESAIGRVDDPSSISGRMRSFDAALSFAESSPGSTVRLDAAVINASDLASTFNTAQSDIQTLRVRADRQIATSVETLNTALEQVEDLNEKIITANVNGHDTSGYLDQRQQLIDQINDFVPVRELQRQNGAVSLVSTRGVVLLEQSAVKVDFQSTHTIMPHMTAQSGDLGSLTIGNQSFDLSSPSGGMSGGALESLFNTRDTLSEAAQSNLDSLAFELATRFQSPTVDPSLGPGDAGLFTDNGARADIANLSGFAGRLSVNAAVDPSSGGASWRLRDGMQAVASGPAGNTLNLSQMIGVLNVSQPSGAPGLAPNGSMLDLAADVGSSAASSQLLAQQRQSTAAAQFGEMQQLMFAQGVDTDAEIQRLLMIETNYAANARVIQTVESMLDSLLRIGA